MLPPIIIVPDHNIKQQEKIPEEIQILSTLTQTTLTQTQTTKLLELLELSELELSEGKF